MPRLAIEAVCDASAKAWAIKDQIAPQTAEPRLDYPDVTARAGNWAKRLSSGAGKDMKRAGRKPKPKPITLAEYHLGNVAVIEVENPLYSRAHAPGATNPQRIAVKFNMRESYVGFLFARRMIDGGEKQAADRVRQAYERMGGAGASAIDYGREHVDGGKIAQTITDSHLAASAVLKEAASWLGPAGYDLTLKFAAEGCWPAEMSRVERQREYLGARFRECLDTLAVNWGYKMRRQRRA